MDDALKDSFRKRMQAAFGPFSQFQNCDMVSADGASLCKTQSRDTEDDLLSPTSSVTFAESGNSKNNHKKSEDKTYRDSLTHKSRHERRSSPVASNRKSEQKPRHQRHRSDHERYLDDNQREHGGKHIFESTKPDLHIDNPDQTKALPSSCDSKFPIQLFNLMNWLDDELELQMRPLAPSDRRTAHSRGKHNESNSNKRRMDADGPFEAKKAKRDAKYIDSVSVPLIELPDNLREKLLRKKTEDAKAQVTNHNHTKAIYHSNSLNTHQMPGKAVMTYRSNIPQSAELIKGVNSPNSLLPSMVDRPASASSMKSEQSVDSHRSLPPRIQKNNQKTKDKKASQLKRTSPAQVVAEKPASPLAKTASPKVKDGELLIEKEKSPFAARIQKDDKSRSSESRENSKPPIGKVEPMLQHMLVHHDNDAAPTRALNIDDRCRHFETANDIEIEAKKLLDGKKACNPILIVHNAVMSALLYVSAAQKLSSDVRQRDDMPRVMNTIKMLDKAKRLMKDTVRNELSAKESAIRPCDPYTYRIAALLQRAQAIIANEINSHNEQEAWKNVTKIQKLGSKKELSSTEQLEYLKVLRRQADFMHGHLDAGRLWNEASTFTQRDKIGEEFFAYLEKLVGAPMRIDNNLTQLISFLATGIEWIKNDYAAHQNGVSPKSSLLTLPPDQRQSLTSNH